MNASKLLELRREVYEANMQIESAHLAQLTWGNVSQIDRSAGIMAIKPSGVPYSELSAENIVLVDLEGNPVDSAYKPSSDTRTHLVLYNGLAHIGGITHTHAPYSCAWAQAQREIPVLGTTHADYSTQSVLCTEVMSDEAIERDYEEETGKQILKALEGREVEDIEMILVACHGPFTWGKSGMKSLQNAIALEEIAKMAFLTKAIRPEAAELKPALKQKHYYRKHGKGAYYGQ